MSADTKHILARISGRVQGVNYRAWTRDEATKRALSGWVRNEDDGTVTAVFSGPAETVDEIVHQLWHGPHAARVEAVEVDAVDPGELDLPPDSTRSGAHVGSGEAFTVRR